MICDESQTTFSERKGTIYFRLKKPDYLFDQIMSLLITPNNKKRYRDRVTGISKHMIQK